MRTIRPESTRSSCRAGLAAALLLLAACGQSVAVAQPGGGPGDPSPPVTPQARRVAPTVNGKPLPPAKVGVPAIRNRNERNQPIELDESASLACASAQFAWVALLEGDRPRAETELAVTIARAEVSEVTEVATGAAPLKAAAEAPNLQAKVETFLKMCESRGYII